jgi:hypothetical protein
MSRDCRSMYSGIGAKLKRKGYYITFTCNGEAGTGILRRTFLEKIGEVVEKG